MRLRRAGRILVLVAFATVVFLLSRSPASVDPLDAHADAEGAVLGKPQAGGGGGARVVAEERMEKRRETVARHTPVCQRNYRVYSERNPADTRPSTLRGFDYGYRTLFDLIVQRGARRVTFLSMRLSQHSILHANVSLRFLEFTNITSPAVLPLLLDNRRQSAPLERVDFDLPPSVRAALCAKRAPVCTKVTLDGLIEVAQDLCMCSPDACDPKPADSFGVCVGVGNEAPFIPEWFEYYRHLGFTFFSAAISIGSGDSTQSVFSHLAQHYPDMVQPPYKYGAEIETAFSILKDIQIRFSTVQAHDLRKSFLVTTDCVVRSPVQFILTVDPDEFLVLSPDSTLATIMQRHITDRVVRFQWIMMGLRANETFPDGSAVPLTKDDDEPFPFLFIDLYRRQHLRKGPFVSGGKLMIDTDRFNRYYFGIHRIVVDEPADIQAQSNGVLDRYAIESRHHYLMPVRHGYLAHFRQRPPHSRLFPRSIVAPPMPNSALRINATTEHGSYPTLLIDAVLDAFHTSPVWASYPTLRDAARIST